MKSLTLATIACVLCMASAVQAEGPVNIDLAERLIVVMEVQETTEKSFEMVREMIPGMMQQMGLPEDNEFETLRVSAVDLVLDELSWDSMKDDYISIYAETFSAQELEGLIKFFESPVGQGFITKQPELMQKMMGVSQGRLADVIPKIQALLEEKVLATSDAQ